MTDPIKRSIRQILCLALLAAGSAQLAAKPCDPDTSKWVPSRYYPAGTVVFHKGEWYESRELHQGLEPGITFEWIELDRVPECVTPDAEAAPTDAPDRTIPGNAAKAGPSERGVAPTGLCEEPEPWQFSKSYTVGSLASHGGQIWEAIRPTNGDMPGLTKPPHWQLVKQHCALERQ